MTARNLILGHLFAWGTSRKFGGAATELRTSVKQLTVVAAVIAHPQELRPEVDRRGGSK